MNNCCIDCFADYEIRAIIKTKGKVGNCSFCGKEQTYILNLFKEKELEYQFSEFISIYTRAKKGDTRSNLLKNFLKKDWYIFNENLETDVIEELIKAICPRFISKDPDFLYDRLIIREKYDKKHLNTNSIFKGHHWEDFSNGIRNNARYHSDYLNHEVLKGYIECSEEIISEGEKFYRARISETVGGLSKRDMGAPPKEKAKGGRANPEGIPYLYLGNAKETVIYEIRAAMYDYVAIGTFICTKNAKVIDLTNFDRISPFRGNESRIEYLNHAINNEHLRRISEEIAKPLRNNASRLEYLPTQYICDFIKTLGYDGIKYRSSMDKEGYNLAIFKEELFECMSVKTYDIESIKYEYNLC